MTALFSSFILVQVRLEFDAGAKMIVLTIIIAMVNTVWLLTGAMLTSALRDPVTNRIVNVTLAVFLLASVAFAFLL